MDMEFPVISMKLLEDERTRSKELAQLAHACWEWEYFQVIDHGIPVETMDIMSRALKALFELPLEVKLNGMDTQEITRQPVYDNKGVPLLNTHKLGYNKSGVATFEIEDQYQEPSEDAKPEGWVQQLLLQLGNPAVIWPEKPDGLRRMIEDYAKETRKVAEKILKCLAVNVGLEADAFLDAFKGRESAAMMMTIVNCMPSVPYGGSALTAPRHRDIGGLSMLLVVDGRPGFQVLKDGKWRSIPSVNQHALIVNVGDLMEKIGNGRYKSLVHRAVNYSDPMRISVASVYNPNKFAKIGPVAGLIDSQHPRLYGEGRHVDFLEANKTKPMTCFEYFSSLKC